MKCIRDMLAIARFDTMRERHRRAWDVAHWQDTDMSNAFVTAIVERIREAHPDRFEPTITSTKAH